MKALDATGRELSKGDAVLLLTGMGSSWTVGESYVLILESVTFDPSTNVTKVHGYYRWGDDYRSQQTTGTKFHNLYRLGPSAEVREALARKS